MWRVAALLIRSAGTSPESFSRGMLDRFSPALQAAFEGDTRLRRLVLSLKPVNLDPAVARAFPVRFDGLLEFWFDTAEDAVAAMATLPASPEIRAAAAGLVDGDSGVAWIAEVLPKKPENGTTQFKFLAGGDAAEGWTVADAQKYWSETHPAIAKTVPQVWEPLTRYVQFHGHEVKGLDIGDFLARLQLVPLCSDMGFARQQDFLDTYSSEAYMAIVRPDEEKFSRPGEMLAFVTDHERDLVGASPAMTA